MTKKPLSVKWRVALTFLVPLVAGEILARIWVASRYSKERIEQLTTHSSVRGRFASHPYLPYVLNPGFQGHNALGFRGGPIEARKTPGWRRIACVGASTTYGNLSDPADSWPAALGRLLVDRPGRCEVVNAGVPGWTSTDILVNLALRVLPLAPDVVVLMPGRNEMFPQAYNRFVPDYTHFRRPGFNFAVSNYVHKEVFGWSRLAMLACTVGGPRFGWSETEEHPLYGGIDWSNKPTVEEALRNLDDPARMETYRSSTEDALQLCKSRGIRVIVCTMQLRPDLIALDELPKDPRLSERLGRLIEDDNAVAREIAKKLDVPVAETAQVSTRKELFLDDSHLTPEGHGLQARLVYDALLPLLDGN